ncbi:MAG: MFS transporter [Bacteroidota bacterium]
MSNEQSADWRSPKNLLLLAGILFIALNLRPALASIGPLVEDIRQATGLSSGALGLLTTLPLIAFGIISTLTPIFTNRFGISGTLLGAMLLLTIGILVRSMDWIPALYIGTILAGIAIAFGNVLLPSLTKQRFSEKAGLVTSLYSSMMAGGAALAAGMSVPLMKMAGLGWRGSLVVWAILAFIALLLWLPQLKRLPKESSKRNYWDAMRKLSGSRIAWLVALFMGFQSFTFYVLLAWLPTILQSRGLDAATSGWLLSLSQGVGILGSMVVPIWAGRQNDQRWIVMILSAVEVISLIALFLPDLGGTAIWVSMIGFVLGGTFGLALLFIVLRSDSTAAATELSGMAQSIGYVIAATGPILFGALFDWTGSWTYPFILLFVVVVVKLFVGWGIGKNGVKD